MAAADLVLLVVDAAVGVTTEDDDVARVLSRSGRPVLLVANKVDNDRREADAWELVSLGLGDPWMVSALHGRGTGDLLDEVVRLLPDHVAPTTRFRRAEVERPAGCRGPKPESPSGSPSWAGPTWGSRPCSTGCSGRSARSSTTCRGRHATPSTPRSTPHEGPIRFIDTAGMRRRSRTEEGTEYYAMVRALQALDHADVVLLVIDATDGVTHQDQRLAERIGASGSPVVIILNKWELLDAEGRRDIVDAVDDRLAFLGDSPTVKVSAESGMGVHKILPALGRAVEAYHHRIPTGELNRAIRSIQAAHAAPGARIRYAVQGAIDPPTFTLFATRRLPAPYLRYVERKLREQFGIGPTPVKFRVRIGS